ncbi:MAG: D-TA family PLP-dependent enzyme [Anaerolineales bacterium]
MMTLDTPSAIVDLDLLAANIHRLQTYLDEHGLANRPHIKTHKIPAIAHLQMEAGAVGITCQKIGEAEVMADAGLSDIFLPYNILGEGKLARLMALARRVKLSVTADSAVVVQGLSDAAQRAEVTLSVLVECDLGGKRCGVQTPAQAAELARFIAHSPGLVFGGLMTYPNTLSLDPFVRETRALLASDHLSIPRVSGGGTRGMFEAHTHRELTEHRAGMYVYGDRHLLLAGATPLETIAFRVRTTVVSRPTPDRGILDAGSKTLSSDLLGLEGYGYLCEYPKAVIYALSEEHAHVDFSACPRKPDIGEQVSVIPNHVCPVTNLLDEVVGVRAGQIETVWAVAARGKVK